ncbi:hypothetical protein [Pseudomonas sp. ML96]|uniref:hypothetical protein n=1 Tax=Pseudomonas sp. ML96 TaxID=1523503 RepID=UPI0006921FA4|nr:hypothetical protein [Pseudomonas sp. ML96]
MLINGSVIGGVVLGGGAGLVQPPAPEPVVPRQSIVWDVRLVLGGEDHSHLLSGGARVETERDSASLAEFTLLLDPGPVNPFTFIGRTVQVYYRDWTGTGWVEELMFDGRVIRPIFEPVMRTVRCDCSDRLQDLIEALTVAQVNALVRGLWSADLFEDPAGRSRWDYAQERKSTVNATLQKRPGGALEMLPLEATAPFMLLGDGVTMDQSLVWTPVELSERVNVVELVGEYRFDRLRERHQDFFWEHPLLFGVGDLEGFCMWGNQGSTELPDIQQVLDETNGAGYTGIINPSDEDWYRLPPSGTGGLCDPPFLWKNPYPDLLLRGAWTGGMRWIQPITERYTIRIEAPTSMAAAGEVIQRDQFSADSEGSDRGEAWESAAFTAADPDAVEDALGDWVVDVRDVDRWTSALQCALSIHRTTLQMAHRENRLAVQMPTSDVMALELRHTLRVEDQRVRCQAPVWSLLHEFDFDAQTALTTITLAVSQGGGGVTDPLVLPPIPPSTPSGSAPGTIVLPTQLQNVDGTEVYDETLDGFAGNWNNVDDNSFPRRMQITSPEIPADQRDEFVAEATATYRVAIPDDLLEFI